MTALWSSLEASTTVAYSKLAGYDDILDMRAVIVTAHMTFQQRVDAIIALCEHLAPSHANLSDFEVTHKLLKTAQKARNKFSHNGIYYDEATSSVAVTYATARASLKLHSEEIRLADIKEASSKIHEAITSLHSLVTGVRRPLIWDRA
jgi:hypothetical protein